MGRGQPAGKLTARPEPGWAPRVSGVLDLGDFRDFPSGGCFYFRTLGT